MAAFRKLNGDEAVKILRDCVTLSFRFNVISRLGTHELEKRFNEAALGLESGAVTKASGVRGSLQARPLNIEVKRKRTSICC